MTLPDLTLLRPLWLLLLPALAVAAWMLRRRAVGIGDWARAVDPALLQAMRALGRVSPGQGGMAGGAALCAAALIAVALSGPAVERRNATAFRNLDGVVFVIDVSRSAAEDARWPQVVTMGRFGIAALGSRPAGLVVYAGDAYVATDMTADTAQLGQTVSLLGAETVPDPGSRPERALALARQMLDEADVLAGDVVMLTDGGGLGPAALQEAAAMAGRGARLSVVAPDAGPEVQTLAATGGGRVFTLADTDALAGWIGGEGRDRLELQDWPLLFWSDLGRWLLALALVPAFLLFRRTAR
ncbi:VWA domain-containing protein [Roseivivax isoporae]|uniref:VWFA domain-containing protein n=1 Tax=Roseivivax isoporae LMG 25204 TaxID=1449351 RepID=X7F990_9RHOB|nr:vWA domain-containing protein [Roseivivax isoporae]ETX28666.1 hypothetical protein RISW2_05050 [Roseivivax isoporae LMG 25204]